MPIKVPATFAADLRDCYDALREATDNLKTLMRFATRHEQEVAKAYWLAGLEMGLDDNHDYVGNNCGNLLELVHKYEGDAEDEEEEETDGPQEGDITTTDHKKFYQDGKLVLTLPEDADHCAALTIYMKDNNFFPSVWFISDHGNAHLIEIPEN